LGKQVENDGKDGIIPENVFEKGKEIFE